MAATGPRGGCVSQRPSGTSSDRLRVCRHDCTFIFSRLAHRNNDIQRPTVVAVFLELVLPCRLDTSIRVLEEPAVHCRFRLYLTLIFDAESCISITAQRIISTCRHASSAVKAMTVRISLTGTRRSVLAQDTVELHIRQGGYVVSGVCLSLCPLVTSR